MNQIVDLSGKIALVTGAGGGIGRAVCQALAGAGARLVVSDIAAATGEETTKLVNGAGGEAIFIHCDVSDARSVDALIGGAVEHYGRLDCAHNNAGIEGRLAAIIDTEETDFDRVIAVTLKSIWLCLRAELRQMVAQGSGAIVNTSSIAGLTAAPMVASYGAAKHGVIGLTRTAAAEHGAHGIRVNAICPGVTRTAMTDRILAAHPGAGETFQAPIQRMADPAEMAGMVAFLLSDAASYMTGAHVAIDGGFTAL